MVLATSYPFLEVFWTMLIFFAFVIWLWILFTVLTDIFRRHDTSGFVKVIWIIFIIILPYFGVFVYLIAEHNGMTERAIKARNEAQKEVDQYVQSVAAPAIPPSRSPKPSRCSTAARSPGRVRPDQAEGAGRSAGGGRGPRLGGRAAPAASCSERPLSPLPHRGGRRSRPPGGLARLPGHRRTSTRVRSGASCSCACSCDEYRERQHLHAAAEQMLGAHVLVAHLPEVARARVRALDHHFGRDLRGQLDRFVSGRVPPDRVPDEGQQVVGVDALGFGQEARAPRAARAAPARRPPRPLAGTRARARPAPGPGA